MSDASNKQKHLEFIQAAINRMSGNLFLLKGWGITLIAGLFALAAKDTNSAFLWIAVFPLIVFWALDAYFLSQERKFRALYDEVRQRKEEGIDFSMRLDSVRDGAHTTWLSALFSRTLIIYYLGLGVGMFALSRILLK